MLKEDSHPGNLDPIGIEWRIHPFRSNWKVSVCLVLFLIALCAAIYLTFNSAIFLILAMVLLVGSSAPFFFPTTYIFRDDNVTIKSSLRVFSRQWDSFKSYYPDKNGVLLSPFSSPSRLENFRGVYVKFGDNRSEVMDFVERKIGKQADV